MERENRKEDGKILKKILEFLKEYGHTVWELSQKLSINEDSVNFYLNKLTNSKKYLAGGFINSWRTHGGSFVYVYVSPTKKRDPLPEKAFISLPTAGNEGEKGLYQRVIILDDVLGPNNEPAKCIEITPFYDIHIGHRKCDMDLFRADVEQVRKRPNRFAIFGGDSIENALGDSAGGAAWADQSIPPDEQRIVFENEIRDISGKTLVMIPGNHEHRTTKKTLMCPLREVAKSLEIPYFAGPVILDITWRGFRWTFHISHGRSGSNTPGGKLNAVGKPRNYVVADFFIMGHVHDKKSHRVSRLVPRREFREGKLVSFSIMPKVERKIICPSYLMYEGTYAQQAGYTPGSRESILIQLNADGSSTVATGSRTLEGDVTGINI